MSLNSELRREADAVEVKECVHSDVCYFPSRAGAEFSEGGPLREEEGSLASLGGESLCAFVPRAPWKVGRWMTLAWWYLVSSSKNRTILHSGVVRRIF